MIRLRLCLLGLSLVALLSSGCAHALGYAGKNPGQISCKGKGVITGTGNGQIGAGLGGGGSNAWTIQADCGDGFTFSQGPPAEFSTGAPLSK